MRWMEASCVPVDGLTADARHEISRRQRLGIIGENVYCITNIIGVQYKFWRLMNGKAELLGKWSRRSVGNGL